MLVQQPFVLKYEQEGILRVLQKKRHASVTHNTTDFNPTNTHHVADKRLLFDASADAAPRDAHRVLAVDEDLNLLRRLHGRGAQRLL